MAEPEQIFAALKCLVLGNLQKRPLAGKKVVVTAGPTREPLDPVRYLSNHSSGRMGFVIAQAAVLMGAETALISGPVDLLPPAGVKYVGVQSAEEMAGAVAAEFKKAHCLIMAAAVADFRPAGSATRKLKRTTAARSLALKPTADILKTVAAKKRRSQLVVGFALETENAIENAKKKLKDKKLDMIVVNQPGDDTGFGTDTNQVTVITPRRKPEEWALMDKSEIACKLVDKIATML